MYLSTQYNIIYFFYVDTYLILHIIYNSPFVFHENIERFRHKYYTLLYFLNASKSNYPYTVHSILCGLYGYILNCHHIPHNRSSVYRAYTALYSDIYTTLDQLSVRLTVSHDQYNIVSCWCF